MMILMSEAAKYRKRHYDADGFPVALGHLTQVVIIEMLSLVS
jgi:hypothetical protein